jgi:SAM-dependent methyltransferase
MLYEAVNQAVLSSIPKTARRLLDIGCGSGALAIEIKGKINCEIVGVTYSESEASIASRYLDRVLVGDLNHFHYSELGKFDWIVCSHILEHLYQPQELLIRLHDHLTSDGKLLVAVPNVLHWRQRWEFLKGNFKYTDGGIMDRTHFRFFDWETSLELIQNSGYTMISRSADGYFPLPKIRKFISPVAVKIDRLATQLLPGLFGCQFILVAESSSHK